MVTLQTDRSSHTHVKQHLIFNEHSEATDVSDSSQDSNNARYH